MEHEVYVPFPVGSVRAALAEAERVARCVPGVQLDAVDGQADADGTVSGRLRIRIGGSTITYRGALTVSVREDGFRVRGEGDEARGQGSVRAEVTLTPRAVGDGQGDAEGTVLVCAGSVRSKGRLNEAEAKQRAAAGRRLLERFAEALAQSLAADPPTDDNQRVIPGIPAPESATGPVPGPSPERGAPTEPEPGAPESGEAEPGASVFETEVPPPSPDPSADEESERTAPAGGRRAGESAPAEAAHARRTMIGRSAEEVDHAPPRGRYAPVPAPETVGATAALRWAAPAAALAVASAVLVGRVLRRRR
ncbi:SRPBCC domain-containing protein [Streptomyces chumphonensis]|uniref:Carbon monoxide dehydrogenase subunit G n=1 Tax=Streptomyces chumphonensis TaxID=1214925 RepID=A0A927EY70_9ACTN|nr:hypothetical protein [Streptomyces chumphonensis]MBD3931863.1 hypothetical protein [Streptomyces chumphonensis]